MTAASHGASERPRTPGSRRRWAGLLLGCSYEHAALGASQRHVGLFGAFSRDEVCGDSRPGSRPGLEREGPRIPSLRVHLVEDGSDGLSRFVGVERGPRVALPHDLGIVVTGARRGVVAAAAPQHSLPFDDCEDRILEVVEASQVCDLAEHIVADGQVAHVGQHDGADAGWRPFGLATSPGGSTRRRGRR